ncbi:hypothetical protein D3C75_1133480 [compost metagenome]
MGNQPGSMRKKTHAHAQNHANHQYHHQFDAITFTAPCFTPTLTGQTYMRLEAGMQYRVPLKADRGEIQLGVAF